MGPEVRPLDPGAAGRLAHLATLSLSTVATALNTDYTFTVFARPTSVQQKAFDLLGVKPERTQ